MRIRYQTFTGQITEEQGLSKGAKGAEVLEMQRMLKAKGFDPGPLDGLFGPRTEAALRAFQQSVGGQADGSIELAQWNQLKSGYDPAASSPVNLTGGSQLPVQTSGATGPGTAAEMLQLALAQNGDRYVFGAETNLDDANPDTFDCSELVQWAVAQAGGSIVDGSQNQRGAVTKIPMEQAMRTPGALLFNGHHVAISLGDGVHTIEAMGSEYGVRIGTIGNRFEDAGLVPGLRY